MAAAENNPIVILVDDEDGILSGLETRARKAKLDSIKCDDAAQAIARIDELIGTGRLVGVVTDLNMNNDMRSGWPVVSHALNTSPSLDLIVYTAYPEEKYKSDNSRTSQRFTIIAKPNLDAVGERLIIIRKQWDDAQQLLVYSDSTQREYEDFAKAYAPSSLPILILGETGTGKESLAKKISKKSYIENKGSKDEEDQLRFVTINCGALEPSLAFSELFGHTKGAFTDAANHKLGKFLEASGYLQGNNGENDYMKWLDSTNKLERIEVNGDVMWDSAGAKARAKTLFLDEVAALPQSVMPGLLRVLETNDVMPLGHHGLPIRAHCRIISATNEVSVLKESGFRKDLLFRLAGAVLKLDPLRDQDSAVIKKFVNTAIWKQLNMKNIGVASDALQLVEQLYKVRADETARAYQAGNFRSLKNLMHRAALVAQSQNTDTVTVHHIEAAIRDGEILAPTDVTLNQQKHIREVFRNALHEKLPDLEIPRDFLLADLKQWSSSSPTETAYAFLRCNLAPRMTGTKRTKYYELREIETALATGYGRGAWIGNYLLQEHIRTAATKYWNCDDQPIKDKKISEIVKLVQETDAR
jgi:DNA-binding NtrC family response regulator